MIPLGFSQIRRRLPDIQTLVPNFTFKKRQKPILISIPHASSFVPKEIRDKMILTEHDINKIADLYTDDIFAIPDCYIVKAKISRLVADPNRAPDDIQTQAKLCSDGVVVHVTEDLKPIYEKEPTPEMIAERIAKYHDTFHAELDYYSPKVKFMIDGHSMRSVGPKTKSDAGKERADIVLGNRGFTTCNKSVTNFFVNAFESRGYSVKVNDPYAGNYTIGYHCNRKTLPGIQIEINKKLYMNQSSLSPHHMRIAALNRELREIIDGLLEFLG